MPENEIDAQLDAQLDEIVAHRIKELEAREDLLSELKKIDASRSFKKYGHKSLSQFCERELGYERAEIRGVLIQLGLVIPPENLVSKEPQVQCSIELLKIWRKDEAKKRGIAAYRILPNRTLLELAKLKPTSAESLAQISGIGPSRLAEYGPSILGLLN
ncbi:MAG: HRDC domain-containing protein [Bdellovibrionota bacterium]